MRRSRSQPTIRNKLDLSDRLQIRIVRRRLHLSDAELMKIVGRIGNSISAISKEAALQRTNPVPEQFAGPQPAVIGPVTATDATAAEGTAAQDLNS